MDCGSLEAAPSRLYRRIDPRTWSRCRHLLIGLRGTHAVANLVRDIKTASTKWVKETYRLPPFALQDGYAALPVSSDRKNIFVTYIANQEEHHRKWSSKDELESILVEAGIPFDRTYFE